MAREDEGGSALWRLLLLPFRPVIAAYGGLGSILERLRLGLVLTLPEVNVEVMMGIASVVPGLFCCLFLAAEDRETFINADNPTHRMCFRPQFVHRTRV